MIIANLYDLSTNAMMVKLVDLYIDNMKDCLVHLNDDGLNNDTKEYILRIYEHADMLSKMSEEETLRRYTKDFFINAKDSDGCLSVFKKVIESGKTYIRGFFVKGKKHVNIISIVEEKSCLKESNNEGLDEIDFKLSYKKWATIGIMFFPATIEYSLTESRITEKALSGIVRTIDKDNSREQMIKEIAEILVSDAVSERINANNMIRI